MNTQTIDERMALAQQLGGTVEDPQDRLALAQSLGGTASEAPQSATPANTDSFPVSAAKAVGNFGLGAAKEFAQLPQQAAQLGSNIGGFLTNHMFDPANAVRGAMGMPTIQDEIKQTLAPLAQAYPELHNTLTQISEGMKQGVAPNALFEQQGTAQELGGMAASIAEPIIAGGVGMYPSIERVPLTMSTKLPFLGNLAMRMGLSSLGFGGMTALQTGGEDPEKIKTAMKFGAVMPLIGEALRGGYKLGSYVVKTIVGAKSGVPVNAIDFALENPTRVRAGIERMSGDMGAEKTLQSAQEALDTVKEAQSSAYKLALAAEQAKEAGAVIYPGTNSMFHNVLPLEASREMARKVIEESGRLALEGDEFVSTGTSVLKKGQISDINAAWKVINNGTDQSPLGINAMRQYVDSLEKPMATETGDKIYNRIITKMSAGLNNVVREYAPEVANMNAHWAATKTFTDAVEKELRLEDAGSLTPKNAVTAMRKLLNVFNSKSEVYSNLVDQLGERGAKDVMGNVAGVLFSRWTPEGLSKYLTTLPNLGLGGALTGAAYTHLLSIPAAVASGAATIAASSPRIVGGAAMAIGKATQSPAVQGVINNALPAISGLTAKVLKGKKK